MEEKIAPIGRIISGLLLGKSTTTRAPRAGTMIMAFKTGNAGPL
ncbi:uncharacterized protein METZ01_LOCUS42295 [marine metagenome]|uniref:Uncharacterized protein n=1 Tax=marine metagenome TaxID=408172 RepID=A0A381RCZ8_9ZZZZ